MLDNILRNAETKVVVNFVEITLFRMRALKKPFKLQPLFIEVINYKVRWMDRTHLTDFLYSGKNNSNLPIWQNSVFYRRKI